MSTPTASPTPRRIARPRWLDPRVIGGLLLVVAAVVVGARVVGASASTTPVWTASRGMAAGTVLTAGDLVAVEVNLGGSGGHYLAADPVPAGSVLTVPVGAGELVPAAAIAAVPAGRVVVIAVDPERTPPGVGHGARVDLYLTSPGEGSTGPGTRLLAANLVVQSTAAPSSGGLSGASANQYQLSVVLEPGPADSLVRELPGGEVTVVLRTGADG